MAKRDNAQWLSDLRSAGPLQETALADLRAIVLTGLPYALANWLPSDHPGFAALAEDVAQESLLRVLAHLDDFEGRSQFTTWVQKIAVRIALTELRRRRWKDTSLDTLMEARGGEAASRLVADPAPDPETAAERSDLLDRLRRIMADELTAKQLRAMTAVSHGGMPLEEVARRMGMKRNALYKLLHDARVRLKRRIEREGLPLDDLRAVFERR